MRKNEQTSKKQLLIGVRNMLPTGMLRRLLSKNLTQNLIKLLLKKKE